MNLKYVVGQLGMLLIVLGGILICNAGWAFINWRFFEDQSEAHAAPAFAIAGVIGVIVGGIPRLLVRRASTAFGRREALLLVGTSWILGAALSGSPFLIWSQFTDAETPAQVAFSSPVNCYFEAMSGLTTTGATILPHIDDLPRSILLWRAATHWLGGLGIIVLFVAVLPTLGAGGKKLFRVEAPGPQPEGVRPQIAHTARILWSIYLGMTIAETIALRIAGMTWFDSVCHTFATLATGGFSTHNASISAFNSVTIEIIIIVFMVMAGVNFGLYYQTMRGRFKELVKDREFRCYGIIVILACAFIVGCLAKETIIDSNLREHEPSFGSALRFGVFQVISIMTTTGFCTADFDQWGFFPKSVLILLMFIGASAGSTGGGIKVIRIFIMFKVFALELERVFRPNVVRPLKFGSSSIDPDLRQSTLAYILGIILIFLVGTGLIMAFEVGNPNLIAENTSIDFVTASTASAATLNNIGPGLAMVSAVDNYGWFTNSSKVVMTILMALGRLEIFAILVLFVPRFWRGD